MKQSFIKGERLAMDGEAGAKKDHKRRAKDGLQIRSFIHTEKFFSN